MGSRQETQSITTGRLESTFDSVVQEFDLLWQSGQRPQIEQQLLKVPETERAVVLARLVTLEIEYRRCHGETPTPDQYLERFPVYRDVLASLFHHGQESGRTGADSTSPFSNLADAKNPSDPVWPDIAHLGRYLLEARLGRGGYGFVWRGHDPQLDRAVAIKLLRPDRLAASGTAADDFLREGRKLAKLHHPGIVSIFDVQVDGSQCYIVSELAEQGSLQDQLKRGKRYTPAEAAQLVADVAEALHYAHHHSDLVHRDVKPANILIDAAGRPRLADFGLATSESEQLSERAAVVGTFAYMSPEQVRGESTMLDARTDIYSLGVVLYQLLTGRLPYIARGFVQYREQILGREPRPPRTINDVIPAELERICLKCLAKPIGERYTTALDVARELRATSKPIQSRRPIGLVAAVAALAVLLLAGVAWFSGIGRGTVPSNIANLGSFDRPTASGSNSTAGTRPAGVREFPDGEWIDLLDVPPVAVVWPLVTNNSDIELNPEKHKLRVTCQQLGLLELGTLKSDSFRIRATVSQIPWTGGFGVYYGFQNSPTDPKLRRFEAVAGTVGTIDRDNMELLIFQRTATMDALGVPSGDLQIPLGQFKPPSSSESILEVEVERGKLTSVHWNGQELDFLNPPETLPKVAGGKFGLLVDHSFVSFRDVAIYFTNEESTNE